MLKRSVYIRNSLPIPVRGLGLIHFHFACSLIESELNNKTKYYVTTNQK